MRHSLLAGLSLVALSLVGLAACGGGGGAAPPLLAPPLSRPGAAPASASFAVASGYITCATSDQARLGNDCGGYANFDPQTSTYAFTAVAADAAGDPIVQQLAGGSPVGFANGSYEVVESANDAQRLVAIGGGPWSAPGAALATPAGSYGNPFTVRCLHTGIAQLALRLTAGSAAGSAPNGAAPGTLLPIGPQKSASMSVNCNAGGSLTII